MPFSKIPGCGCGYGYGYRYNIRVPCGTVAVRLISGTWVATVPESLQFCLVFVDLYTQAGLDSGGSET